MYTDPKINDPILPEKNLEAGERPPQNVESYFIPMGGRVPYTYNSCEVPTSCNGNYNLGLISLTKTKIVFLLTIASIVLGILDEALIFFDEFLRIHESLPMQNFLINFCCLGISVLGFFNLKKKTPMLMIIILLVGVIWKVGMCVWLIYMYVNANPYDSQYDYGYYEFNPIPTILIRLITIIVYSLFSRMLFERIFE